MSHSSFPHDGGKEYLWDVLLWSKLSQLVAWEDFISFNRHEGLKFYKMYIIHQSTRWRIRYWVLFLSDNILLYSFFEYSKDKWCEVISLINATILTVQTVKWSMSRVWYPEWLCGCIIEVGGWQGSEAECHVVPKLQLCGALLSCLCSMERWCRLHNNLSAQSK
jgi:hypothetical protein